MTEFDLRFSFLLLFGWASSVAVKWMSTMFFLLAKVYWKPAHSSKLSFKKDFILDLF